jgi:hypothetical protein
MAQCPAFGENGLEERKMASSGVLYKEFCNNFAEDGRPWHAE